MQPTVVFLDMDGPMQSARSALAKLSFDPVGVAIVNRVIQHPGVRSVLSSTIRVRCEDEEVARERMARYGLSGMTFHRHWRTGHSASTRSAEIQAWMSTYREDGVRYVAIDDDPINIPYVIHIPADHNGIAHQHLLHLLSLIDRKFEVELDGWTKWLASR